MRFLAAVGVLVAVCAASSGCGGAPDGPASRWAGTHPARAMASPAGRPAQARPTRTSSPSPVPPPPVPQRPGRQLITVTAASYGTSYAVFTAYRAEPGAGWRTVFGPWTARLGTGGLAPPGEKREGDWRTPSGTYGFGFFFGVEPDPGVSFPYRQSQPYDMWDDDPSSSLYNEWVDERHADPGASPEPMFVSGYDYGAVIAYNTARTPGLGSAIFLHIDSGSATAGCVTLPEDELLEVLRWLRPSQSPRIQLAVAR